MVNSRPFFVKVQILNIIIESCLSDMRWGGDDMYQTGLDKENAVSKKPNENIGWNLIKTLTK